MHRKWTKEESQRLNELYEQFGTDWVVIATFFPGRIGDQCGLQYRTNFPHIRRSKWIKEEDEVTAIYLRILILICSY